MGSVRAGVWLISLLCNTGVLCLDTIRGPLPQVACSEGLSCEVNDKQLCLPGKDIQQVSGQVLLLSGLSTSSVVHCESSGLCSPCVQIHLNLSISILGSSSISSSDLSQHRSKSNGNMASTRGEGSGEADGGDDEVTTVMYIQSHQNEGGKHNCVELRIELPPPQPRHNRAQETGPVVRQGQGTVEFSCFPASMDTNVLITVFTDPKWEERRELTHKVPDCFVKDFQNIKLCRVPEPSVSLEDVEQRAVITVPANYFLRFQYNVVPEFESTNPQDSSKLKETEVQRSFRDIVPCLCIEVWSASMVDAWRRRKCPFTENPEFRKNVWRLSRLHVETRGTALQWTFSAPCNVSGHIILCYRSLRGDCQEVNGSRQQLRINTPSEFGDVDPHPSLCVQVVSELYDNLTCPFESFVPWTVHVKLLVKNVTLIVLHPTKMDFSMCAVNGDKCELLTPTIQETDGMKQFHISNLSAPRCLQIWRSDVSFSARVTVCPFDIYARTRWLLLLAVLLAVSVLGVLLLADRRWRVKGWIKKIKQDYRIAGPQAGCGSVGKVLVLYSLDHEQYEKLVSTFANLLLEARVEVVVDLWRRREMCAQGPLPWTHAQKRQVTEDGGKIVLLFSRGANTKSAEWLQSVRDSTTKYDPYDGFMAALNCVLPDIVMGKSTEKYIVAYFEDLHTRAEIPQLFSTLSVYALPSQLTHFLQELGGSLDGRPSWPLCCDSLRGVINECRVWEEKL